MVINDFSQEKNYSDLLLTLNGDTSHQVCLETENSSHYLLIYSISYLTSGFIAVKFCFYKDCLRYLDLICYPAICNSVVDSVVNEVKESIQQFPNKITFMEWWMRSWNLSLKLAKDIDQEARYSHIRGVPSSPSADWPLPSVEENGGIDSLPFRLMLQDCTAVKTLLLKMKRVLQEIDNGNIKWKNQPFNQIPYSRINYNSIKFSLKLSVTFSNSDISVDRSADMSPASSTTSLPVSPLAEEPLPFKDIMKDECSMLKLQLKEKDELISQLQEELSSVAATFHEAPGHVPGELIAYIPEKAYLSNNYSSHQICETDVQCEYDSVP
ncbi:hypothetical protein MJG53_006013 [Ovis ammon polii x Ovis aries]|uniref:Uncharacterized protein n=1 Tax=Ovis ammon polii x Ovis aries TaxID=2918886 RepID=A0ACB9V7Q3_9CETA|nr:hypothetical protein MJG53_006013 [Ovis ammon polii x Ovis aries]